MGGDDILSTEAQLSVLASAGVLSVDPSFQWTASELRDDTPISLIVPNEDALAMAVKILKAAVPSRLRLAAARVNRCLRDSDLLALFSGETMRNAIAAGTEFFAGVQEGTMEDTDAFMCPAEFRVSLSVSSAMFMLRGELVAAYRAEEACPQVDMEQLEEPAPSPTRRSRPWKSSAGGPGPSIICLSYSGRAAERSRGARHRVQRGPGASGSVAAGRRTGTVSTKYQLVDVNGAELRFSAFVFDDWGTLFAGAQPRSLVEAVRLVHDLRSGSSADDVFLAVRCAFSSPVHACSPVCGCSAGPPAGRRRKGRVSKRVNPDSHRSPHTTQLDVRPPHRPKARRRLLLAYVPCAVACRNARA